MLVFQMTRDLRMLKRSVAQGQILLPAAAALEAQLLLHGSEKGKVGDDVSTISAYDGA